MNIFLMSLAMLMYGLFIAGGLTILGLVVYNFVTAPRQMEDRSDTSWNTEHHFFDTVTEFRNDFSGK